MDHCGGSVGSVRDCLASGRGDPMLLTEIDLTPRRGFGARSGARRGSGHRMTALSILFVGLLPGMKRATEADHLAPVRDLATQQTLLWRSPCRGACRGPPDAGSRGDDGPGGPVQLRPGRIMVIEIGYLKALLGA
jgi:hypothetical protein